MNFTCIKTHLNNALYQLTAVCFEHEHEHEHEPELVSAEAPVGLEFCSPAWRHLLLFPRLLQPLLGLEVHPVLL